MTLNKGQSARRQSSSKPAKDCTMMKIKKYPTQKPIACAIKAMIDKKRKILETLMTSKNSKSHIYLHRILQR